MERLREPMRSQSIPRSLVDGIPNRLERIDFEKGQDYSVAKYFRQDEGSGTVKATRELVTYNNQEDPFDMSESVQGSQQYQPNSNLNDPKYYTATITYYHHSSEDLPTLTARGGGQQTYSPSQVERYSPNYYQDQDVNINRRGPVSSPFNTSYDNKMSSDNQPSPYKAIVEDTRIIEQIPDRIDSANFDTTNYNVKAGYPIPLDKPDHFYGSSVDSGYGRGGEFSPPISPLQPQQQQQILGPDQQYAYNDGKHFYSSQQGGRIPTGAIVAGAAVPAAIMGASSLRGQPEMARYQEVRPGYGQPDSSFRPGYGNSVQMLDNRKDTSLNVIPGTMDSQANIPPGSTLLTREGYIAGAPDNVRYFAPDQPGTFRPTVQTNTSGLPSQSFRDSSLPRYDNRGKYLAAGTGLGVGTGIGMAAAGATAAVGRDDGGGNLYRDAYSQGATPNLRRKSSMKEKIQDSVRDVKNKIKGLVGGGPEEHQKYPPPAANYGGTTYPDYYNNSRGTDVRPIPMTLSTPDIRDHGANGPPFGVYSADGSRHSQTFGQRIEDTAHDLKDRMTAPFHKHQVDQHQPGDKFEGYPYPTHQQQRRESLKDKISNSYREAKDKVMEPFNRGNNAYPSEYADPRYVNPGAIMTASPPNYIKAGPEAAIQYDARGNIVRPDIVAIGDPMVQPDINLRNVDLNPTTSDQRVFSQWGAYKPDEGVKVPVGYEGGLRGTDNDILDKTPYYKVIPPQTQTIPLSTASYEPSKPLTDVIDFEAFENKRKSKSWGTPVAAAAGIGATGLLAGTPFQNKGHVYESGDVRPISPAPSDRKSLSDKIGQGIHNIKEKLTGKEYPKDVASESRNDVTSDIEPSDSQRSFKLDSGAHGNNEYYRPNAPRSDIPQYQDGRADYHSKFYDPQTVITDTTNEPKSSWLGGTAGTLTGVGALAAGSSLYSSKTKPAADYLHASERDVTDVIPSTLTGDTLPNKISQGLRDAKDKITAPFKHHDEHPYLPTTSGIDAPRHSIKDKISDTYHDVKDKISSTFEKDPASQDAKAVPLHEGKEQGIFTSIKDKISDKFDEAKQKLHHPHSEASTGSYVLPSGSGSGSIRPEFGGVAAVGPYHDKPSIGEKISDTMHEAKNKIMAPFNKSSESYQTSPFTSEHNLAHPSSNENKFVAIKDKISDKYQDVKDKLTGSTDVPQTSFHTPYNNLVVATDAYRVGPSGNKTLVPVLAGLGAAGTALGTHYINRDPNFQDSTFYGKPSSSTSIDVKPTLPTAVPIVDNSTIPAATYQTREPSVASNYDVRDPRAYTQSYEPSPIVYPNNPNYPDNTYHQGSLIQTNRPKEKKSFCNFCRSKSKDKKLKDQHPHVHTTSQSAVRSDHHHFGPIVGAGAGAAAGAAGGAAYSGWRRGPEYDKTYATPQPTQSVGYHTPISPSTNVRKGDYYNQPSVTPIAANIPPGTTLLTREGYVAGDPEKVRYYTTIEPDRPTQTVYTDGHAKKSICDSFRSKSRDKKKDRYTSPSPQRGDNRYGMLAGAGAGAAAGAAGAAAYSGWKREPQDVGYVAPSSSPQYQPAPYTSAPTGVVRTDNLPPDYYNLQPGGMYQQQQLVQPPARSFNEVVSYGPGVPSSAGTQMIFDERPTLMDRGRQLAPVSNDRIVGTAGYKYAPASPYYSPRDDYLYNRSVSPPYVSGGSNYRKFGPGTTLRSRSYTPISDYRFVVVDKGADLRARDPLWGTDFYKDVLAGKFSDPDSAFPHLKYLPPEERGLPRTTSASSFFSSRGNDYYTSSNTRAGPEYSGTRYADGHQDHPDQDGGKKESTLHHLKDWLTGGLFSSDKKAQTSDKPSGDTYNQGNVHFAPSRPVGPYMAPAAGAAVGGAALGGAVLAHGMTSQGRNDVPEVRFGDVKDSIQGGDFNRFDGGPSSQDARGGYYPSSLSQSGYYGNVPQQTYGSGGEMKPAANYESSEYNRSFAAQSEPEALQPAEVYRSTTEWVRGPANAGSNVINTDSNRSGMYAPNQQGTVNSSDYFSSDRFKNIPRLSEPKNKNIFNDSTSDTLLIDKNKISSTDNVANMNLVSDVSKLRVNREALVPVPKEELIPVYKPYLKQETSSSDGGKTRLNYSPNQGSQNQPSYGLQINDYLTLQPQQKPFVSTDTPSILETSSSPGAIKLDVPEQGTPKKKSSFLGKKPKKIFNKIRDSLSIDRTSIGDGKSKKLSSPTLPVSQVSVTKPSSFNKMIGQSALLGTAGTIGAAAALGSVRSPTSSTVEGPDSSSEKNNKNKFGDEETSSSFNNVSSNSYSDTENSGSVGKLIVSPSTGSYVYHDANNIPSDQLKSPVFTDSHFAEQALGIMDIRPDRDYEIVSGPELSERLAENVSGTGNYLDTISPDHVNQSFVKGSGKPSMEVVKRNVQNQIVKAPSSKDVVKWPRPQTSPLNTDVVSYKYADAYGRPLDALKTDKLTDSKFRENIAPVFRSKEGNTFTNFHPNVTCTVERYKTNKTFMPSDTNANNPDIDDSTYETDGTEPFVGKGRAIVQEPPITPKQYKSCPCEGPNHSFHDQTGDSSFNQQPSSIMYPGYQTARERGKKDVIANGVDHYASDILADSASDISRIASNTDKLNHFPDSNGVRRNKEAIESSDLLKPKVGNTAESSDWSKLKVGNTESSNLSQKSQLSSNQVSSPGINLIGNFEPFNNSAQSSHQSQNDFISGVSSYGSHPSEYDEKSPVKKKNSFSKFFATAFSPKKSTSSAYSADKLAKTTEFEGTNRQSENTATSYKDTPDNVYNLDSKLHEERIPITQDKNVQITRGQQSTWNDKLNNDYTYGDTGIVRNPAFQDSQFNHPSINNESLNRPWEKTYKLDGKPFDSKTEAVSTLPSDTRSIHKSTPEIRDTAVSESQFSRNFNNYLFPSSKAVSSGKDVTKNIANYHPVNFSTVPNNSETIVPLMAKDDILGHDPQSTNTSEYTSPLGNMEDSFTSIENQSANNVSISAATQASSLFENVSSTSSNFSDNLNQYLFAASPISSTLNIDSLPADKSLKKKTGLDKPLSSIQRFFSPKRSKSSRDNSVNKPEEGYGNIDSLPPSNVSQHVCSLHSSPDESGPNSIFVSDTLTNVKQSDFSNNLTKYLFEPIPQNLTSKSEDVVKGLDLPEQAAASSTKVQFVSQPTNAEDVPSVVDKKSKFDISNFPQFFGIGNLKKDLKPEPREITDPKDVSDKYSEYNKISHVPDKSSGSASVCSQMETTQVPSQSILKSVDPGASIADISSGTNFYATSTDSISVQSSSELHGPKPSVSPKIISRYADAPSKNVGKSLNMLLPKNEYVINPNRFSNLTGRSNNESSSSPPYHNNQKSPSNMGAYDDSSPSPSPDWGKKGILHHRVSPTLKGDTGYETEEHLNSPSASARTSKVNSDNVVSNINNNNLLLVKRKDLEIPELEDLTTVTEILDDDAATDGKGGSSGGGKRKKKKKKKGFWIFDMFAGHATTVASNPTTIATGQLQQKPALSYPAGTNISNAATSTDTSTKKFDKFSGVSDNWTGTNQGSAQIFSGLDKSNDRPIAEGGFSSNSGIVSNSMYDVIKPKTDLTFSRQPYREAELSENEDEHLDPVAPLAPNSTSTSFSRNTEFTKSLPPHRSNSSVYASSKYNNGTATAQPSSAKNFRYQLTANTSELDGGTGFRVDGYHSDYDVKATK